MMLMGTRILLALSLVLIGCAQFGRAGLFGSSNVYEEVEDFLTHKSSSDSPAENIETLERFIGGKVEGAASQLVKTVKEILSLSELTCDKAGLATLQAHEKAMEKLGPKNVDGERVYRRIERVIDRLAKIHANKCQETYAKALQARANQLEGEELRHVQDMTLGALAGNGKVAFLTKRRGPKELTWGDGWTMESLRESTSESLASNLVEARRMAEDHLDSAFFYDALFSMTKDGPGSWFMMPVVDAKGERAANEAKVRELFENYMLKPCEHYLSKMDREIMELVMHDDKLIKPSEDRETRLPALDLYFNKVSHALCTKLTKDHKQALKTITHIISNH